MGVVDTSATVKRLQQELMALMAVQATGDISAFPQGDNLFSWLGTIRGPAGTPYEGLSFRLALAFPADYPYTAPRVSFETPIFHPNVDERGGICLDILKDKWSPVYSVHTILISVQSLLGEPNNDSPLNPAAARLWADQDAFRRAVRELSGGLGV